MTSFDVKGMTCGHCVQAVTRAVHEIDASASVDVDLKQGVVRVESNESDASIVRAIEQAGYEAAPRAD